MTTDHWERQYQKHLAESFDPEVVTLAFGAIYQAEMTLAGAMGAKDAWRDDDELSIAWITDPRGLGETAIRVRFAFKVTDATATAVGGAPGSVHLKRVQSLERRRGQIGNLPIDANSEFYRRRGLSSMSAASWMVLGPPGTVCEVVLGTKLLAKKKPAAGARALQSGKALVAGVSVARVEIPESGWAAFELPLRALLAEAKQLGLVAPDLFVLAAPTESANEPAAKKPAKRPAAKRPAKPEPTFDEATLLATLVRTMNDVAVDSFPPGVHFLAAERAHEHIVLRYAHEGRPRLARAHRPEPLETRAALHEVEDDLCREISEDTSEI